MMLFVQSFASSNNFGEYAQSCGKWCTIYGERCVTGFAREEGALSIDFGILWDAIFTVYGRLLQICAFGRGNELFSDHYTYTRIQLAKMSLGKITMHRGSFPRLRMIHVASH